MCRHHQYSIRRPGVYGAPAKRQDAELGRLGELTLSCSFIPSRSNALRQTVHYGLLVFLHQNVRLMQ